MGWSDLDNADAAKKAEQHKIDVKQQIINKANAYSRLFRTEDGEKVLNDLTQKFIYENSTSLNAKNITYEAGYHAGEAGIVKYIISMIQKAQEIK